MNIEVPREQIEAFCRRWKVTKLVLFGSVLRDDFRPDSDVDVLVKVDPGAAYTLFDFVEMENELAGILGREVDLIEKDGVVNPWVREQILRNHRVVYAA